MYIITLNFLEALPGVNRSTREQRRADCKPVWVCCGDAQAPAFPLSLCSAAKVLTGCIISTSRYLAN